MCKKIAHMRLNSVNNRSPRTGIRIKIMRLTVRANLKFERASCSRPYENEKFYKRLRKRFLEHV